MLQLTHWQHLAICAALTERSFPNYALYCEIEGIDPQPLRKMLNKVWEFLRGQLKSSKNIEKQLEALTDHIPDPETKDHYGAYPAMDTALALQSCLQAIVDASIEDAEAILTMMAERLEEVIALQSDDDDAEPDLDASPLWQRHQQFIDDLMKLVTSQSSHADMVKKLIPLASDHGVSHLGICVDED